jgi:hypothetical protein
LLLVLTLLSSFLVGTIGLISVVRDSERVAKQNLIRRMELRRFANDFRRDVAAADLFEVADSRLAITLNSPISQIMYRTESNQTISRTVTSADDSSTAHDRYLIGDDAEMTVTSLEKSETVAWSIRELGQAYAPTQIMAMRRRAL